MLQNFDTLSFGRSSTLLNNQHNVQYRLGASGRDGHQDLLDFVKVKVFLSTFVVVC